MIDQVSDHLRELAAELVLPRFRRLQEGEIEEKSPGEVVPVVDREVERELSRRLLDLLPGSRVVGEEAAAADPSILNGLEKGTVWLVDPLDGTSNFATGNEDFSMMVALLREGTPAASWMLAPVTDSLSVAEAGAGACRNGTGVTCTIPDGPLHGVVKTRFLPPRFQAALNERKNDGVAFHPGTGSAGIDYPKLVSGAWHFLFYWRTLPWDHVPGTLFLKEAGGVVRRLDGDEYRVGELVGQVLVAGGGKNWTEGRMLFP